MFFLCKCKRVLNTPTHCCTGCHKYTQMPPRPHALAELTCPCWSPLRINVHMRSNGVALSGPAFSWPPTAFSSRPKHFEVQRELAAFIPPRKCQSTADQSCCSWLALSFLSHLPEPQFWPEEDQESE